MDTLEVVLLVIEVFLMLIVFKTGSIRDKMDKIESVLEDINAKLGEKEED